MRKTSLASVSFLLSLIIVYGLNLLARSLGLSQAGFILLLIAASIMTPITVLALTKLNQPLLKWRKVHGRDIELEEKHEIEGADIISIKPREFDDRKTL
jgi:hypothetical protein